MLEQTVIILAITTFIAGLVAAAILPVHAVTHPAGKPSPQSLPATQTADVEARAGADPAGRL
jgi:hypothetical protein